MSKEVSQVVSLHTSSRNQSMKHLNLNQEQHKELASLYEDIVNLFKPGKIVIGKVIKADSDGVLVDIGYKSDGQIPRYEFSDA